MEKYTVFMDQKNQHSENEYTTQSNLQMQCNPYQATHSSTLARKGQVRESLSPTPYRAHLRASWPHPFLGPLAAFSTPDASTVVGRLSACKIQCPSPHAMYLLLLTLEFLCWCRPVRYSGFSWATASWRKKLTHWMINFWPVGYPADEFFSDGLSQHAVPWAFCSD